MVRVVGKRGRRRAWCAAVLVGGTCLALASPPAGGVTTTASSVWGSGFANIVAWSSTGDTAAVGGDTSGVHVSDDGGQTWYPASTGMASDDEGARYDVHVASLLFVDDTRFSP